MEIDPSKFAMSASNSLLNQLKGTYHATENYNLKSITEEGIKAGFDLVGTHTSSGRLHSHWGVFPPWDQRNRVTRSRSSVERWIPLVTLYVPIIDIIRERGKVTESGVIICNRPVSFRLVKEVWVCLPSRRQHHGFDHVEKILDYEVQDELCPECIKSPVADSMQSYRSLKRLMGLLCDMQGGPHDAMREAYVSRLSDYCDVPWNPVDWNRYEDLYKEATDFLSFTLHHQGMQGRVVTQN